MTFFKRKKIIVQPVTFLCSIGISAPNPASGFPPLWWSPHWHFWCYKITSIFGFTHIGLLCIQLKHAYTHWLLKFRSDPSCLCTWWTLITTIMQESWCCCWRLQTNRQIWHYKILCFIMSSDSLIIMLIQHNDFSPVRSRFWKKLK